MLNNKLLKLREKKNKQNKSVKHPRTTMPSSHVCWGVDFCCLFLKSIKVATAKTG